MNISRRHFVILAAGSLSIGLTGCRFDKPAQVTLANTALHAGSVLTLGADNHLLLIVDKMEMGQGISTATAMLVAGELGIPANLIDLQLATPGVAGGNPHFVPSWGTGGSSSVPTSWQALRNAGGLLRHLLLTAAARAWNQPITALKIDGLDVVSTTDQRRARFADLIPHVQPDDADAYSPSSTPLPAASLGSLHQSDICSGKHIYSSDVVIDGMLHAVVLRDTRAIPPLPAAASAAGIRIVALGDGHALVGKRLWQLLRWRRELESQAGARTSVAEKSVVVKKITPQQALDQAGFIGRIEGRSMPDTAPTLSVDYNVPYLAHAAIEPLSCIVSAGPGRCELWLGTQRPVDAQRIAAEVCGLETGAVKVHTYPMGGSFGRRLVQDYVREAVTLGWQLQQPVKLVWTREDDMRHSVYRPAAAARMQAWFDGDNQLQACHLRIAAANSNNPSNDIDNQRTRAGLQAKILGNYHAGHGALEGIDDLGYQLGNWRAEALNVDAALRTGAWRSVGHSHNAFFIESFIDELAAHAGTDPVQWRLAHLPADDGLVPVLKAVAARSGWPQAGANASLGIAAHRCFGSNVALVVRIEGAASNWRVTDLFCAFECGQMVNENGVLAQVEGGLLFGLSAALYETITPDDDGRVAQSSFRDYPVLRMNEAPRLHIELIRSSRPPAGVGEPAVPVVAPALANAITVLTGQRPRALPLRRLS